MTRKEPTSNLVPLTTADKCPKWRVHKPLERNFPNFYITPPYAIEKKKIKSECWRVP